MKQKDKTLIIVSISLFALLILFIFLINPGNSDDEIKINRFANKNNISKTLAIELEQGVIYLGYTLDDIYDFAKIDNWAYGTRYKFNLDFEQTYIAYCKSGNLVSINANLEKVYEPSTNKTS